MVQKRVLLGVSGEYNELSRLLRLLGSCEETWWGIEKADDVGGVRSSRARAVTAGPATTCLRVVWTEPTPQISSEYILLLQDSETPPYPSSFWCTILMVITRECTYYCV